MTTYRWAIMHKEGDPLLNELFHSRAEACNTARLLLTDKTKEDDSGDYGDWRVAKFKLVECEEGEGDGE